MKPELQVVAAAPGHQPIQIPPVGGLITVPDEPNDGDVIHKLDKFYVRVAGHAAVGVQLSETSGSNMSRVIIYTAAIQRDNLYINRGCVSSQPAE